MAETVRPGPRPCQEETLCLRGEVHPTPRRRGPVASPPDELEGDEDAVLDLGLVHHRAGLDEVVARPASSHSSSSGSSSSPSSASEARDERGASSSSRSSSSGPRRQRYSSPSSPASSSPSVLVVRVVVPPSQLRRQPRPARRSACRPRPARCVTVPASTAAIMPPFSSPSRIPSPSVSGSRGRCSVSASPALSRPSRSGSSAPSRVPSRSVSVAADRCGRPPRRRCRGGRGRSPRRRRRRRRGPSPPARLGVRPPLAPVGQAVAVRVGLGGARLELLRPRLGERMRGAGAGPVARAVVGGRRPGQGQRREHDEREQRAAAGDAGHAVLLREGGAIRGPSPSHRPGGGVLDAEVRP